MRLLPNHPFACNLLHLVVIVDNKPASRDKLHILLAVISDMHGIGKCILGGIRTRLRREILGYHFDIDSAAKSRGGITRLG